MKFDTSKGVFVVEVHRDWAPNGADRFYNLVKNGFYNDTRFFRVISGFMVQFGINGDPKLSQVWRDANIKDDPVKAEQQARQRSPSPPPDRDTRTTQVFINFGNNAGLDDQGFAPFGQVISGMEVVDSLYSGYGEGAPQGHGPEPGRRAEHGQRLPRKGVCQARLRQDGDDRALAHHPEHQEQISWQNPKIPSSSRRRKGKVTVEMRTDLAPQHVARIKELARQGFYDGVPFHRVIEGFMAQTGDPTGTGTGGSGKKLKAEFNAEPHTRGAVSMARAQSPDSADSQFFICFDDASFLDKKYTVWGRVIDGMENVDKIKRGEPPANPDKIVSVRVAADARPSRGRPCASPPSTFDLPEELIALRPAIPRDAARLLVVDPLAAAPLTDRAMGDLPCLLRPGDALVFNDTKVIPAELGGMRDRDGRLRMSRSR